MLLDQEGLTEDRDKDRCLHILTWIKQQILLDSLVTLSSRLIKIILFSQSVHEAANYSTNQAEYCQMNRYKFGVYTGA